jgi:hypothetical protein
MPNLRRTSGRLAAALLITAAAVSLAGCGSDDADASNSSEPVTLRLGYFPKT